MPGWRNSEGFSQIDEKVIVMYIFKKKPKKEIQAISNRVNAALQSALHHVPMA